MATSRPGRRGWPASKRSRIFVFYGGPVPGAEPGVQQQRGVLAVPGGDGGCELLVEVTGVGDVVGDDQDAVTGLEPSGDLGDRPRLR